MATGEDTSIKPSEILDGLLTCNICLETLKEPKLLPCLHTFCKMCIHAYFDSFKEKKAEKIISCPVCRKSVSTNLSFDNVEAFVNTLPDNNFALTMLNKLLLSKSEKFCDSCRFNGTETKAASWCIICEEAYCKQCENDHKKFKITAKHELSSIKDIDKTGSKLTATSSVFCSEHQESAVQVYCIEHKKACCALCATFNHRTCENVIPIDEATSNVKNGSEVSGLLKRIDENVTFLTSLVDHREQNETEVDTEITEAEKAVKKLVKDKKEHLDKIQNKILSELDAVKKQTSMKVADDINDITSYKSAALNWRNILTGNVKHGSNQQCLVALNEIASKVDELENEMEIILQEIRNVSVQFKESNASKDLENTLHSLGDIKLKESKYRYANAKIELFNANPDYLNGEIKVLNTIQVAENNATTGIFLNGLMVFTTYNDSKVVKYNISGKLIGELKLPSSPGTDLCHVTESRIVVVTRKPCSLYFVECKEMTLLKTMTLTDLRVPVWGICVYDTNQFLVGYGNQLTWISQTDAEKLRSVKTSGYSFFVTSFGSNDYIYANGKNFVSCMKNDTKAFTYISNKLSFPCGIGVDETRNFYISGKDSKNIHQITRNGDLVRIIPASAVGVDAPISCHLQHFRKGYIMCHRLEHLSVGPEMA